MNFGIMSMMRCGIMPKPGDVILATVQFTDTFEVKKRPALVLFEEFNNVVVCGITSNPKMRGIPLIKAEGVIKDCVIKLNYIFTITNIMVEKIFFKLSSQKKNLVYQGLLGKLSLLKNS